MEFLIAVITDEHFDKAVAQVENVSIDCKIHS
jgi:hypothetical protein